MIKLRKEMSTGLWYCGKPVNISVEFDKSKPYSFAYEHINKLYQQLSDKSPVRYLILLPNAHDWHVLMPKSITRHKGHYFFIHKVEYKKGKYYQTCMSYQKKDADAYVERINHKS